jgi:hypothetical protein
MAANFLGICLVFGVRVLVFPTSRGFSTLPTALVLQEVFEVRVFHPSDPADFD